MYFYSLITDDTDESTSNNDGCCQILKMSSNGIATKLHNNKLGYYHLHGKVNGNRVYQIKESNKFLHKSSNGFWTVSI